MSLSSSCVSMIDSCYKICKRVVFVILIKIVILILNFVIILLQEKTEKNWRRMSAEFIIS